MFREIHKTAYLKWLPPEQTVKVKKKCNVVSQWTLLCIHNGVAPYLERYGSQASAGMHKPMCRVSLLNVRHVTASVMGWPGNEYDFVIVTNEGAVRLLAPDWDAMQDWVSTLRNKLRELGILGKSENVYGAPPVVAVPRAPARDPMSPLPPTPAAPPIRVPGIEPAVVPATSRQSDDVTTPLWGTPTTSHHSVEEQSMANIQGENICLEDSILSDRSAQVLNNKDQCDPEAVTELSRTNVIVCNKKRFKHKLLVNNTPAVLLDTSSPHVTVIQVPTENTSPSPQQEETTSQYETLYTGGNVSNIQVTSSNSTEHQARREWRRGVTELSLFTKLRGGGGGLFRKCEQQQPTETSFQQREQLHNTSRVRRRRSSSLSNETSSLAQCCSLRVKQTNTLRGEISRSANICMRVSRSDLKSDPPRFTDWDGNTWISYWGPAGYWCDGRPGDRVLYVRGTAVKNATHARDLLRMHTHAAEILFNRIPLGRVWLLLRRTEDEPVGIELGSKCEVVGVTEDSPAGRASLPPPDGRWTLTEVNNRPLHLIKDNDNVMTRLNARGMEVSLVIQPTNLVKKLRSTLK